MRCRHRLIAAAGTLLVAATLAPAALAAQDERSPDAQDAAATASFQDERSPDAVDAATAAQEERFGGAATAMSMQDQRSPDAQDAAAATTTQDFRSPDAIDAATPVVVHSEPLGAEASPWSWESAAVGALASLGLLLALGGGGVLVTRRRATAA